MRLWFHALACAALLAVRAAASDMPDTYAPARPFADAYAARDARTPAPESPLLRADGAPATLADWRGRPVLAVFWATWCPVCREEMPKVATLARALPPDGPAVVAISVDVGPDAPAAVARHMETHGIGDLTCFVDEGQAVAAALGLRAIPTAVFLDAEGRVAGLIEGRAQWDAAALRAHLEALGP